MIRNVIIQGILKIAEKTKMWNYSLAETKCPSIAESRERKDHIVNIARKKKTMKHNMKWHRKNPKAMDSKLVSMYME